MLRELRRQNPILIIYVCADRSVLGKISDYARAGADKLFTIHSPSDLAHVLDQVLDRIVVPPPEVELRTIGALEVPPVLLQWVQHVFRNAYRPAAIGDVARGLGETARRIDERLQNYDLPCLRDLWRCGRHSHLVELERRGVSDPNDRARRIQFGDAIEVTKFRYRLRVTMRRNARLAKLAAHIPSFAPLL